MLNNILNFVLDMFFWICGLIGSIVIYPIQALIVTIFPSMGDFLNGILNFFQIYVGPMISFIKELILEISCLPEELYLIFIGFAFTRYVIAPAIRTIKLIVNIWKFKSGGSMN